VKWYLNTYSHAYAEQSLKLCREIWVTRPVVAENNDDKLMVAEYDGRLKA